MSDPITKVCPTYWVNIHIAGDLAVIKQTCRVFCQSVGLCVTVTPTDYIYTGGSQTGATIRLINYPRFPKTNEEIYDLASRLAQHLKDDACQESFTLETPSLTTFYSWRAQDLHN